MREHGTRTKYVHEHCHCEPCTRANSASNRARERAKLYGRYDAYVKAGPIRAHVLMLSQSGMGRRRLSELSGVSQSAIQTLKNGTTGKRGGRPPERIRKETAARLLEVQPDPALLAAHSMVPARGTQRRVQALATQGWTLTRIAGQVGWTPQNLDKMLHQDFVLKTTADRVAALYERNWNRKPPVTSRYELAAARRSQTRTSALGWVPPMGWDDIDEDEQAPKVPGERAS